ncbi:MAG: NAD(P)-binding protein [Alphaproteobacteria bacterium]|nr:NAD(P)-binding protein [Alphaproteobacteria bacterium]
MSGDAQEKLTHADYDVIVVGGGFAGLAAAKASAAAGARTLVLEAKPDLGARLHTTGILVQEAHDLIHPPAELLRKVEHVRLYGPNRKHRDLAQLGYAFYTTDTGGLLKWMGEEARAAGAEIRTDAAFVGGYVRDGRVEVAAGGRAYSGWYLIGADGAKSPVAKAFALSRNTRFLVGVEREYRDIGALDPERLHVVLDSAAAPGYVAWAAAHPQGAQVGLAVSHGKKPKIEAVAAEIEGLFGLKRTDIYEKRAGLIPCGGRVRTWRRGIVALTGDAAGFVSPLTAGGIRTALQHGAQLGAAAATWILHKGPPVEFALEGLLPRFGMRPLLRRVLDLPPPNWVLQMLVDAAPAATFAKRIFFTRPG